MGDIPAVTATVGDLLRAIPPRNSMAAGALSDSMFKKEGFWDLGKRKSRSKLQLVMTAQIKRYFREQKEMFYPYVTIFSRKESRKEFHVAVAAGSLKAVLW